MRRILCIALLLGSLFSFSEGIILHIDKAVVIRSKDGRDIVKYVSTIDENAESVLSDVRLELVKAVMRCDKADVRHIIVRGFRLEKMEFVLDGKVFNVTENSISMDRESVRFCCIETLYEGMKRLLEEKGSLEERFNALKQEEWRYIWK